MAAILPVRVVRPCQVDRLATSAVRTVLQWAGIQLRRAGGVIGTVELERLMARGWQGTAVEKLGDWLLRAGSGFTGRANSVLPLGSPGCELVDALARVDSFYRRHDLPAMFQIPVCAETADLDRYLTLAGWSVVNASVVLTASLHRATLLAPPADSGFEVAFDDRPDADWLTGYLYRGSPLPASAIEVLVNADDVIFASLRDGESQLAVVRGVLTDGWLGVTALTVSKARRRGGIGSVLMGELFRWAARRGAHSVYLQVAADNDAALGLYQRLSFAEHHRYHYRRGPQP
ncbi:MAG: GNAT family N-acetyltransferase [Nakamurella sp.]